MGLVKDSRCDEQVIVKPVCGKSEQGKFQALWLVIFSLVRGQCRDNYLWS